MSSSSKSLWTDNSALNLWRSLPPHFSRVPGSTVSLHTVLISVWVSSGMSGFLPPPKNTPVVESALLKRYMAVNECRNVWAHGGLAVLSRVCAYYTAVPGIGSRPGATLSRVMRFLKMNEWTTECLLTEKKKRSRKDMFNYIWLKRFSNEDVCLC